MTRAMKRTLVAISSSSEEMSSQESEDAVSSNGDSVQEISFSTCHEQDNEDDDDEGNERKDEESCCRRVTQLLREDSDIQVLTLMDCKAYLRRHGLRLSGSRAECIQRIKEHWRLKDGNGEVLYPRSTFFINCTGDVCRGDVVLFNQKVYKKFNKASKSGHLSGKRWVAGRVVKESYGAAKQQHTFTVEVLWSTGVNRLPALNPLLIKGRNLYRMKTFRQRWKDENQRAKVLEEKHKRGDVARSIRETRWAKSAMRKQSTSTNCKGRKRQKRVEHSRPSQNVRPFVEGVKKAEEHKNLAEQKNICKQQLALPITSHMTFMEGGKQAEERKNLAEQKKICRQKVTLPRTSEKVTLPITSKIVALPITSDMSCVEGGKQAEKRKNPADKKKICKQKVVVPIPSEKVDMPIPSEKVAMPITSDMPFVEGGKQTEERKNLAEHKKICNQKVTLPRTSEKVALPITSDMASVEGGKRVEKRKKPTKQKKICKQKVTLPRTSDKVALPVTSEKVAFVEGGKQSEERKDPAEQKEICMQEVTLPRTSDMKTSVLSAHSSHPIPRYTYTAHPFEVRPSPSQPLAFPRYPTHFPLEQNHRPLEVRPSSSQPLAFPRYPTHLPLEQNHQNAPNFFSSSGPFSNSGFSVLHPPPASVDLRLENHRYHAQHSQETGWRNSGSYCGPPAYPERRSYHSY